MAYEYPTMLDVAKINGSDAVVGLIEENINEAPEAQIFPARTIDGVVFKTLQRTVLPVSQFRAVNEGVEPKKSEYANKLVECYYLDNQMEIDVAAAGAVEQGGDYLKALEADGHMRSALQHMGSQVWYGVANDAKGFPGAQAIVDTANVLDAGGTTAATGSSVYGVRLGPKFVTMVFGNGHVFNVGEWRTQTITRAAKEMTAFKNSLEGWVGVQWVNKHAVCRLKDATADAGMTVTDAKLAQLLSQLKWVPDRWFMSRRSRYQLQVSRSATTNNDSQPLTFAPQPTESNGIPITVTDSLVNTEALTA